MQTNNNDSESSDSDDAILFGYSVKELTRLLMVLATKMCHNGTYSETENISELSEAMSDSPEKPLKKFHFQKIINKLSRSMSCNTKL